MEIQTNDTLESLKILKENNILTFVLKNWVESIDLDCESIQSLKDKISYLEMCYDDDQKNICVEAVSSLSRAISSLSDAKKALKSLG